MEGINRHELTANGKKISYLDGGPHDGPLLIFIHGWPSTATTWKPQLIAFAHLGFRVIAPDMPGYGESTVSRDVRDYSLERIVAGLLALLSHVERTEAVWIGHDWGSPVVWSLVAHHPEVSVGVVNLCVPYRTLEFGHDDILQYTNRTIYPADQYPYGQWDYQVYYEKEPEKATKFFESNVTNVVTLLYSHTDPATYGKPAFTARVTHDGGWFGGAASPPDVPRSISFLDDEVFKAETEALTRNGFFGATAYYLNHDVNRAYSLKSVNGGVLTVPTLFIEARYDPVCSTATSRLAEPMRKYIKHLTETSIEAGHWVNLEKPLETNAALSRWLATTLPSYWPWYWKNPLVSQG